MHRLIGLQHFDFRERNSVFQLSNLLADARLLILHLSFEDANLRHVVQQCLKDGKTALLLLVHSQHHRLVVMGRGRFFQKLNSSVVHRNKVLETFNFLLALFQLLCHFITCCALKHLSCLLFDNGTQGGLGNVSTAGC